MTSQTAELERQIEKEQDALVENLTELEQQAKELVDWRVQVRKHPRAMLGAALGGGLLVALLAGSSRPRNGGRAARRRDPEGDGEPSAGHDAWEMLKGALVTAAATQVTNYVVELLPDFREHLEAERKERLAKRAGRPAETTPGNGDAG